MKGNAMSSNIREFFIRRWEQEYPGFIGVLRALPPDRLDYRPHPRSRSAVELASFLVSIQQGCIDLCTSQQSSYNSSMRWHSGEGASTLDEMLKAYEHHHETLALKLNKVDDQKWNHAAWIIRGEQEILLK